MHRRAAPCPADEETEVCLFIHLTHTREVPPSCQAPYWGYTKTDKISYDDEAHVRVGRDSK